MEKDLNYYMSLKYPFEIHTDFEEGGYVISYPNLPGCLSCAETLEETLKMGEDAKKCWIETALENGLEIPEPKTIENYSGHFRIRMPKQLHKDIATKAEKDGISMNQYCVYLLSRELERHKKL